MTTEHSWTSTRLLDALRSDDNSLAWIELDDRIRPIIFSFARRRGVTDQDAADIAQDTLIRVVQLYREGQYNRERGRLRSWVLSVARYRILDWQRARAKDARIATERISALPDPDGWEHSFDEEWKAHILRRAFEWLRSASGLSEKRIRAFELSARENKPIDDVANELGMSKQAVYMARHECSQRLHQFAKELEKTYEDG